MIGGQRHTIKIIACEEPSVKASYSFDTIARIGKIGY